MPTNQINRADNGIAQLTYLALGGAGSVGATSIEAIQNDVICRIHNISISSLTAIALVSLYNGGTLYWQQYIQPAQFITVNFSPNPITFSLDSANFNYVVSVSSGTQWRLSIGYDLLGL